MTRMTLGYALHYASRGWPVFPCCAGAKAPATRHGYLDATTDPEQIKARFGRRPDRNLAVATGAPGPDVLDIDLRGEAGNGFAALARLRAAGLLDGAWAWARTPSGGHHAYFTGTGQHTGHLPARHLDCLSGGGYVLLPPSHVGGRPYEFTSIPGGRGQLDWQAVTSLLEPARQQQPPRPRLPDRQETGRLAAWVAAQPQGNRNAGLYWAANRALEADPAADLSPLAVAARQAGLTEPEITRTLNSARRAGQPRPATAERQAEGEAQ
jgi:hypothetical protein